MERLKAELFSALEKQMESEEISQGEVARRIGALRHNINKVMRGKISPSLDYLVRMAEAAEMDLELKAKRIKK